jgi:hypothetical protein
MPPLPASKHGAIAARVQAVDVAVDPEWSVERGACTREQALRWAYKVDYPELIHGKWLAEQEVTVMVKHGLFGEGGLRKVERMRQLEPDGSWSEYVAKTFKFDTEKRDWYFREVESQVVAACLADEFNRCQPPKKIKFVMPYTLELLERPGKPLCNVEPLMVGAYEKHNDNSGGVYTDHGLGFTRNTPQTYSHFTWESSRRSLIVCDVQGVADLYTDPQVHTIDQQGFGQGNCGIGGIQKFLCSHTCNDICRYFRLPVVRKERREMRVTCPAGLGPGQQVTITDPYGQPAIVSIPEGVSPGMLFTAAIECLLPGALPAPQEAVVVPQRQPAPPPVYGLEWALVAVRKMVTCPSPPPPPGSSFSYLTADGRVHLVAVPPGVYPGQRFPVMVDLAVPRIELRAAEAAGNVGELGKREAEALAKRFWKNRRGQQQLELMQARYYETAHNTGPMVTTVQAPPPPPAPVPAPVPAPELGRAPSALLEVAVLRTCSCGASGSFTAATRFCTACGAPVMPVSSIPRIQEAQAVDTAQQARSATGALVPAPAPAVDPPPPAYKTIAQLLPPGWEERVDHGSGKKFYVDHNTQTTHWSPPAV